MMSASTIQKLLTRIRHVKMETPLALVVPARLTHHCITTRLMLQANFPAQPSKIMNSCFRANLLSSITIKNNQMRCMSATSSDTGSKEHIEKLVKNNKVVVFMKGVPEQPMCGFSNAVTQILRMHGVNYDSHNVLDDDSLRAGIKVYSDWPTIPQVYLNGEFLGGCDIMLQMHQNGDLVEELKTVGIRSALLDQK